jgi:small subunit ribosomal protein S1
MPDPNIPEARPATESDDSFDVILSHFEKSHSHKVEAGGKGLQGTVITVSSESVLLDIGFKTEGILPLTAFQKAGVSQEVKPGDKFLVNVKGRDPEGYYELSLGKLARPTDWPALEQAFAEKAIIAGTVTSVVKGGLSVDVGVRAFMPASRSGARDAAEMEKLVGQEIRCRITKLDVTEEDVVVDRRAVAEEEGRATKERRYSEVREGETVSGEVRSLTDYGAFVDLGGVDALLHVSDISWSRINKAADVLSVGQQIEVRVLKVDPEKRRISVGMKQLQAHPWDSASDKLKVGERVRGTVTRVAEFGAFVELEPGIEGLIHVSEMSWAKKVRMASDVVKPGESVEAVILSVNVGERRIGLGLKQALGDPWAEVAQRFAVGSVIEGPVTSMTKFGAFVQLSEGVEGMIHISEISTEKRGGANPPDSFSLGNDAEAKHQRINHPQDVLKVGQTVKAQVLAVDREKRQLRLSMKQLVPSGLDEYIAGHKEGDVVTGRMTEVSDGRARVELGEGVYGTCRMAEERSANKETHTDAKVDLASLSSMLNARWKGGAAGGVSNPEAFRAGQIRSFRIVKLDLVSKNIKLEIPKG